ncbi:hypothetical protein PanWU01x14_287670 [Parasponia andersonii]|uniref:Reverse transcriptase zinc-binding domain-containing protein n=1 Tax=Parasponia andersonii TaxID=3476 RepID=A0A2P5AYS0_PARAD|nr:hypothetical protein PanWU01x14_287670 [Parasponia andersonii]
MVNQTTDVAHSSGWNFHFVRAINEKEMDELSELLDYLATTTICSSLDDRRVWLPDKIKGFSYNSSLSTVQDLDGQADFIPYKMVWKSQIPKKIKAFGWLVALAKLNT